MSLPVTAAGHRLLVELDIPEHVKRMLDAGLALPDDIKSRHTSGFDTGTLVGIGKTAWKAFDDGEPWAKLGDKVMLVKYSGHSFKHDDKMYRLINDEDIYGVINDKAFNIEVSR